MVEFNSKFYYLRTLRKLHNLSEIQICHLENFSHTQTYLYVTRVIIKNIHLDLETKKKKTNLLLFP